MTDRKQDKEIVRLNEKFSRARDELSRVIVGQQKVVDHLFIAILADGHVLLEGLPGLAKTMIVNSLAKIFFCDFKRIQFTPDLLPADLIGTSIYNLKESAFSVKKGPIFTNILLADEINRAPAKVQSALLEVMQEKRVTISGETFDVAPPFLVFATQNPIEQEGTYVLPEAQTDRFMMKVKIDYPSVEEEKAVVRRMAVLEDIPTVSGVLTPQDIFEARKSVNEIYVDEKIIDYILKIVFASRHPADFGLDIGKYILYGASPRASIGLILAAKATAFLKGRSYVNPNDVKSIAPALLRHRLRRTYEAEADEILPDDLIGIILSSIPVP